MKLNLNKAQKALLDEVETPFDYGKDFTSDDEEELQKFEDYVMGYEVMYAQSDIEGERAKAVTMARIFDSITAVDNALFDQQVDEFKTPSVVETHMFQQLRPAQ